MDLQAVMVALAQVVRTAIPGLIAYEYAPENIETPAFMPGDVRVEFDQTFNRRLDAVTVLPIVLLGRSDDKTSQRKLNAYLSGSGAASLKAAIEGTPGVPQTLSGTCHDLHVKQVTGRRYYEFGSDQYVGAELEIFIIGSGS